MQLARRSLSATVDTVASRGLQWVWNPYGEGYLDSTHRFTTATRRVTAAAARTGEVARAPAREASAVVSSVHVNGASALEMRYVLTPREASARVDMYVTAKVDGDGEMADIVAIAAVDAAAGALPTEFVTEAARLPDPPDLEHVVIELRAREEVLRPTQQHVSADYYLLVHSPTGDGSGWGRMWRALTLLNQRVDISVLVVPTDPHPAEFDVIGDVCSALDYFSETRQDYDILGRAAILPADVHARRARDAWVERLQRLHAPVLVRVAVRAEPSVAAQVATILASSCADSVDGDRPPSPLRVQAPTDSRERVLTATAFDSIAIIPWGGAAVWADPHAPHSLRRTSLMFGLDEAAALVALPLPDANGSPGIPLAREADLRRATTTETIGDSEPSITLGSARDSGRQGAGLRVPLGDLTTHALVCGTTRSGKTTTVMTLLQQLWVDHRVPFLVVECSKTEYRALMDVKGFHDLRVITLGRDDIAPLRLNPLAPPRGVRRERHQSRVLHALRVALPLPDPLPQLIDEALDLCYRRAGWTTESTTSDGLRPPTLRDLQASYAEVFAGQGYVGQASNLGPAFDVRLRSLLRGGKGRVFDTVESSDLNELFESPCILELDEVEGDDKAVFAAFILDRLRSHAAARDTSGGLAHVTVIEEAHRVLPELSGGTASGDGTLDTRAAVVEAFTDAVAELRAAGEGIVFSSQSPSRLARNAIKNTRNRVIHRMEDDEDRSMMLRDFGSLERDAGVAARLRQGEAFVRSPSMDEPELVRVDPAPGIDSTRRLSDDELRSRLSEQSAATRALLPFRACTRQVCTTGCLPARRSEGEIAALDLTPELQGLIATSNGLTPADAAHVASRATSVAEDAYCALAHADAGGQLGDLLRRRPDQRPALWQAITTGA